MTLTEADITRLVTAFYAQVRKDPMLAPIFATKIAPGEWPQHEAHIADFWSNIFLKSGRFEGSPMRKHLSVIGITPAHFTHWLELFDATGTKVLNAEQGVVVSEMAHRIGESLQMGLAFHHGKNATSENAFADYAPAGTKRRSVLLPPHSA